MSSLFRFRQSFDGPTASRQLMHILDGTTRFRSFRRRFGQYDIVKPGNVSKMKVVPGHIITPPYYRGAQRVKEPLEADIKTETQIRKMRRSCQLARHILNTVGNSIKVGMTTDEIDTLVHNLTLENGAYPSPLYYKGFPKSVCVSVNNVICHGIPDDRPLHDGDIVNVDITVYLDGYHGDCSDMFLVGAVDVTGIKLVNACYTALHEAIGICRPGENFAKIGAVISAVAEQHGLSVISGFAGHGIGEYFHGPPDIFHFCNTLPGCMSPGMTFTIEPMLSSGIDDFVILEDGWTVVTTDNARSAQWEHTILITENGFSVLTE